MCNIIRAGKKEKWRKRIKDSAMRAIREVFAIRSRFVLRSCLGPTWGQTGVGVGVGTNATANPPRHH